MFWSIKVVNSKAIRSNKTSLPIAIYVHLADCQSQLIVNLSQLLILVRNWTKRLKGYLDPIRGCRVCLFDLFFSRESDSRIANVRPLVSPLVCPSSIAQNALCLSESLLLTIEPIDRQAYWPLSLLTIEPIDHQAFQPSSLLIFEPIYHRAYQSSSLPTIEPIDHQAYRPSRLSIIEPINHWAYWPSSLSTIKPINRRAYQPLSLSTIKLINHQAYWPSSLLTSGFQSRKWL